MNNTEENKNKPSENTETVPKVQNISQIQTYWNNNVKYYLNFQYTPQSCFAILLNVLDLRTSRSILDVGCGTCLLFPYLNQLRPKDCSYTGVELSETMLKVANSRIKHLLTTPNQSYTQDMAAEFLDSNPPVIDNPTEYAEHKISLYNMNSQDLNKFADQSFDTYVSNYVLMLTENPDKMIAQCQRVLKKGGKAAFTVWGRSQNSSFGMVMPTIIKNNGVVSPPMRSNFHMSDRQQLIKKFQDAGFVNVIAWYQLTTLKHRTKEEFEALMGSPGYIQLFSSLDQELADKIQREYFEAMTQIVTVDKYPITHEGLLIYMEKP